MKKLFLFLLATLMIVSVACSDSNEYPAPMALSADMPAARPSEGESIGYFTAPLYFVSQDGRTLSCEEREIELSADMSIVERAVRVLLDGPSDRLLLRSVPTGLALSRMELSDDVCNVYLTGTFPREMRSWLIARTAIASTVTAVGRMSTVNVYFDEQEPGYAGRALGAQTSIAFSLDAYLTNLHQEYEVLPLGVTAEEAASVMRNMTLYYIDTKSALLIPKNKQVSYSVVMNKAELTQLVLNSMLMVPDGETELKSPIPSDVKLASAPTIEYRTALLTPTSAIDDATPDSMPSVDADADETAVEASATDEPVALDIDAPCTVSIALTEPASGYDEQRMCGAITLSITGFLPKVEGVYISFARTNVVTGEKTYTALNGGKPFVRADFARSIGYGVYIDCPKTNGVTLSHTKQMVESEQAYSLKKRLELLLDCLAIDDDNLLTADKIKDVYQVNDMAVIDWAQGFSDYALAYIGKEGEDSMVDRETSFVFSIVNTMCELPKIQRVWMLENGEKMGRLNHIYLGNSLYKHSGLAAGD